MKIGRLDLSSLSKRERFLVLGGGGALLVFLLYFFIYSPLQTTLQELKTSISTQNALNVWMKANIKQVQALKARGVLGEEVSPKKTLQAIQASIQKAGLKSYVVSFDEKKETIKLTLKKMPFDSLVSWLEKIWNRYGIGVREIQVQKAGEGLIDGALTLQKPKKASRK